MVSGKMPALLCVMLLSVRVAAPLLVRVIGCTALDAPTVVAGKAVMPVTVMAGPDGVTLLDGAEGRLVPITLVAVTVKVYGVPLVRPVTMIGPPVAKPVMPPGFDVAV